MTRDKTGDGRKLAGKKVDSLCLFLFFGARAGAMLVPVLDGVEAVEVEGGVEVEIFWFI